MKIEDIKVHVSGEGNGLILLHGWGQSHQDLLPIYDYFKSNYRVLSLDVLGFNENKDIEQSYTIAQYAHIIYELTIKYGLENCSIIGHSFGARIAFYFASMYPCSMLLLTGAAGIKPKRTCSYYYRVYMYKMKKKLHLNTRNMGSVDYQNTSGYLKETLVKCVNEDLSPMIQKVGCPILLIWGEHDDQTPLYMAHKIVEINDKAELIVFKEDDHFAIYHQMPRFIRVCEYALKEVNK